KTDPEKDKRKNKQDGKDDPAGGGYAPFHHREIACSASRASIIPVHRGKAVVRRCDGVRLLRHRLQRSRICFSSGLGRGLKFVRLPGIWTRRRDTVTCRTLRLWN